MFRMMTSSLLVVLTLGASSLHAEERRSAEPVAPSPAVAAAWAKEAGSGSGAVRALFVSYGVVQALDMASTVKARNLGAVESNPVMLGSYAKGVAVKAALGAATMVAVRAIEKKNKKAALVTMIAANVATATVIAHNLRVAQQAR